MEIVELLERVYKRIEKPENFIVGALAKDEFFRTIPPEDPRACRWCVLGALRKEGRSLIRTRFAIYALRAVVGHSITDWSDTTPHDQVLAGLAKAIEMERNRVV